MFSGIAGGEEGSGPGRFLCQGYGTEVEHPRPGNHIHVDFFPGQAHICTAAAIEGERTIAFGIQGNHCNGRVPVGVQDHAAGMNTSLFKNALQPSSDVVIACFRNESRIQTQVGSACQNISGRTASVGRNVYAGIRLCNCINQNLTHGTDVKHFHHPSKYFLSLINSLD